MGTLHSRVLENAADMGTVNFVWAEEFMIGQCCMYKEKRMMISPGRTRSSSLLQSVLQE